MHRIYSVLSAYPGMGLCLLQFMWIIAAAAAARVLAVLRT
jgi:hypothetical protein